MIHLLDETTYRLDHSPNDGELPALDMRALSNAMIADCILAFRDGAGHERFPRTCGLDKKEQLRRTRINERVRDLAATVAWLNGGEAIVPFHFACTVTDRDPISTRRGLARSIGLHLSEPGAQIVGPYTHEHAKTAGEFIRASLETDPKP